MIKGKFYTGLTSEMMARSRTVDRQQTNFYWPDEADAESATPTTRAKRIASKSMTANNSINNNNNSIDTTQSDIKPKDLVRKQLSSGIEFYDNVNAKTPEARRRRFKKIDNINLNNINNDNDLYQPEKKKLETFSSKIEFYDFENESRNDRVNKNEKKEKIEKPVGVGKAINVMDDEERRIDVDMKKSSKLDSPDVGKKRISFQTTDKPVEKTKSILKNSDDKPNVDKFIVKPLPKRGLFPKNLSKSVENISKMAKNIENDEVDDSKTVEKLSTIIKEVKNLNLSKDDDRDRRNNYHRRDDRDAYYGETDYTRRNNLDRDYDRGYNTRSSARDRYDERYRNEPPPSYKYSSRYNDDYNDRGDRDFPDRRNERFQRSARDPYEYETDRPSGRFEKGRTRDRHPSPNHDRYDNYYDREYDVVDVPMKHGPSPPRTPSIRDGKSASTARDIQRKSFDRYYDEPSSMNRSARHAHDAREAAADEEYSACISRKPKHIPQHLRTNILFNGKVRPQAQRPMSVRNSAVTRVGVGLPDIE